VTPLAAAAAPPLRVERLTLAQGLARAADAAHKPFAALSYGASAENAWISGVAARVLLGGEPMIDLWHAGQTLQSGTTGVVRWRTDGHWLLGVVDLHEDGRGQGLAAPSERAYRNIFEAMKQAGCPHFLRIWNYLPRINDDGGGMERYRQFNVGRQQAFLDAGQAAFEGAPAACALGVHEGALCVRFLAGRVPPVPVENPRQVSAYNYPSDYGPRSPTFSRAALAELGGGQVALFISGTASIVGHESLHAGNLQAQLAETLTNLRAVIGAANQRTSARFTLERSDPVVYVRRPADAPLVRRQLEEALGAGSRFMRHAVFLEADICRSDLLVEIEAHATEAGALRP
jgi:chorismate lyase/3-hydroxybenzoate synthase